MAANMAENSIGPEGFALDLAQLTANFSITGTFAGGQPYGSGHIHDTFRIRNGESGCPDYLLQRINTGIFGDVPRLMENIVRITAHLRARSAGHPGLEVLRLVPARDGRSFHEDEDGGCWRMYVFIDGHRSFDRIANAELACAGGRHFGRFLGLMADFPDPPPHETIREFHNVEIHLQRFFDRCREDRCRRAGQVSAETEFVRERAEAMKRILRLGQAGRIVRRITHNDTKFNNILFAERGGGACVIDLDTVMPGYVHYDFGDAVRSGCNRAGEDAADLDRVELDIDLFKGYARGFLSSLRGCLTAEETVHLAFSARLFAYMVGMRFLSDFLAGDSYFKSRYPGHNLQRARVQFRLLESMERQAAQMEDIIQALAAGG
jgi:hypothetical protein